MKNDPFQNRSPMWSLALAAFVTESPAGNSREKITFGLKALIVSRTLLPGDRIPSARELARILHVHPNTVYKVFKALVSEGMLSTRSTTGTYVTPTKWRSLAATAVRPRFHDT